MQIQPARPIFFVLLLCCLGLLARFILFKEQAAMHTQSRQSTRHRNDARNYKMVNLELFSTIKSISNSRMSTGYKYKNIGGNIVGFMPLGLLLPLLFFRSGKGLKSITAVFLISLSFETIQFYTGRGVFDVDDLFLNTSGGLAGYLLYLMMLRPFFSTAKADARQLAIPAGSIRNT